MQLGDKKVKEVPPGLFELARKKAGLSKKMILIISLPPLLIITGIIGIKLMDELKERRIELAKRELGAPKVIPEKPEEKVKDTSFRASESDAIVEAEKPRVSKERLKVPKEGKSEVRLRKVSSMVRKKQPDEIEVPKKEEPLDLPYAKDSGMDYLFRAYDFERRGLISEAIGEYRDYLKVTGKEDSKILNKLAALYVLIGDLKSANYFAELGMRIAPTDVSILLNYGVIKAKMNDVEEAERTFKKVLEMEPSNRNALYNLALLKERKGEKEEAERLYLTLKELGDHSVDEAILRLRSHK